MEDAEYKKRPAKIFRYFPPDASDIFSTRKLWFSAAKDFNDIFEVLPRYDSLISSEIEASIRKQYAFLPPNIPVSWQKYKKFMQVHTSQIYSDSLEVVPLGFQNKFSEHFGIICFSENPDSLLMWGHYANSHQGFVVEFDPNHPLFSPEDFGKIVYSTNRPIAEASQNWKSWKMLLTKSEEWRYESEYRLIRQLKTLNWAKRRDGKEKYYIDLPHDAVRAVYFGCKVLQKAQDEILTDLKVDDWKYVSKFAMRRHDSQYAIQPLPLEKLRHLPEDARKDFDDLWQIMGIK